MYSRATHEFVIVDKHGQIFGSDRYDDTAYHVHGATLTMVNGEFYGSMMDMNNGEFSGMIRGYAPYQMRPDGLTVYKREEEEEYDLVLQADADEYETMQLLGRA